MRKTLITDIILMYISLMFYILPLTNIYNSIKIANIEYLLINTLFLTSLTTNIIISQIRTINNKITISNLLLTLTLSLTIIQLGLTPKDSQTITKIITYSIPTLYFTIITIYTLANNENFKKWLKKQVISETEN